jgi:hypothetical protein
VDDVTILTNRNVSPTTPKLVIDELLNIEVANKVKQQFFNAPIVWNEIESEKFIVPVPQGLSGNNQTQKVSLRSTGFKNKTLGRILLQKRAQGVNNPVFRKQVSSNFVNEIEQIRVNGRDLLPDSGCDSSAYRAGLVTDTWGNYCSSASSNQLGLQEHWVDENVLHHTVNVSNFFGMTVADKIDYLQLNFNRDYKNTYDNGNISRLNDAVELLLFGECQRAMVKDKFTGYQIVYV